MERYTERILLLLTPSQRERVVEQAKSARLSLAEYLRRKVMDEQIDTPAAHDKRLSAVEGRIDAMEKGLAQVVAGLAAQAAKKVQEPSA